VSGTDSNVSGTDSNDLSRQTPDDDAISRRDLLARVGLAAGAVALSSPAAALGGSLVQSSRNRALGARASKKTLTWSISQDPTNIIPMAANGNGISVTYYLYESLLGWDANLNQRPSLARSWDLPNPTTFVFHLREGVRFHSGKLLDAEDVKYSIEIARNPPAPGVSSGFFPPIDKVTIVNKNTVKIHTSQPAENLLGFFAWGRYGEIVPAGLYERTNVRTHADGTGPFMLAEYVPNDHITLARNPHYWRKGVPGVDQLILKILPDESTRLSALRSGAIDGGEFSATSAQSVGNSSSLSVKKLRAVFTHEFEFGLKDKSKPWSDVRVRQAINAAIDRQDIINKVFAGQGYFTGKIPQGYGDWPIPASLLKSKYEKYDPVQAAALLKAAGYSNGFPITITSIAQPAEYTDLATVVASQLGKVGIHATVKPEDIATLSAQDSAGQFEMESTGRGMRGDVSGFFADFDPTGATYKAWFAGGGWNSPTMTKDIKLGIAATNLKKRHGYYRQMETIVLTQWPVLPTVSSYTFLITRSRVKGLKIGLFIGWDTGLDHVTVA
jgi:peptide/nickel transport system substrate-binding protein